MKKGVPYSSREDGYRINLINCRIDANMTQSDVAKEIGIGLSTYAAYESGYRGANPYVWKKLSILFDKDIDYLKHI